MSGIVQVAKPSKPFLSNAQKTFQRLKKKIEKLQKDRQAIQRDLDKCLQFYYEQLQPQKKQLFAVKKELVVTFYAYYKDSNDLKPKSQNALKQLILDKVAEILGTSDYNDADRELCDIFKELEGESYDEVCAHELDDMKKAMQEMFKEECGVDLDLSEIDMMDDEPEIMRKIAEAMKDTKANEDEKVANRPKSKKQLQKEQQREQLEALQKKEVSTLYKQLAKTLHPDLEQDPVEKVEKEELMKRLTSAYDSDDIHALLLLEMEWLSRSESQGKVQSNDQLQIYNSLLREQIETLEASIEMIVLHPKYLPIEPYVMDDDFLGISTLTVAYFELHAALISHQNLLNDLRGKGAKKVVHTVLQEWMHFNK